MTRDKALLEAIKAALEPYLHEHLTPQAREDVARAALSAAEAHGWVIEKTSAVREATMAERARCAAIARAEFAHTNGWSGAGECIATAIEKEPD